MNTIALKTGMIFTYDKIMVKIIEVNDTEIRVAEQSEYRKDFTGMERTLVIATMTSSSHNFHSHAAMECLINGYNKPQIKISPIFEVGDINERSVVVNNPRYYIIECEHEDFNLHEVHSDDLIRLVIDYKDQITTDYFHGKLSVTMRPEGYCI